MRRKLVKSIEEIWPDVEKSLKRLVTNLNESFPRKRWMQVYTSIYDYCTTCKVSEVSGSSAGGALLVGRELYRRLVKFLTLHMKELESVASTRMDESLLHFYFTEWERYTTCIKYVNHLFNYLNRHWIKRAVDSGSAGVYPIGTLAIVVWREQLFSKQRDRVSRALLSLIEKERCGEQIDTHLVMGVVRSYVRLGSVGNNGEAPAPADQELVLYKACLEKPLLESTTAFYRAESSHFIATNSIADYMMKIESRLAEEAERARQYLHSSTAVKLLQLTEDALVGDHVEPLWEGFEPLLEAHKTTDLGRLYRLLLPRGDERGVSPLLQTFASFVQARGLAAMADLASQPKMPTPVEFVDALLSVYDRYRDMVRDAFSEDVRFVECIDRATKRFVNDNDVCTRAKSTRKSPELIARYCDGLLRKSAKLDIAELERKLTKVMNLFQYIDDRDVFQTFYAKLLAKRLIHDTSASEDFEGQMIGKLKEACGHEYTTKLQCMFTDMSGSRDLVDAFRDAHAADYRALGFDFKTLVLATNAWPLPSAATNFSLPPVLKEAESLFTRFYVKKNNGRKLNWLHQLAKADVKTHYTVTSKVGYTFQCSTYQLAVLLMFNKLAKGKTLTAEVIQMETLLNDAAMRQTLLALVKTTVLQIDPKPVGGVIKKTHRFRLNLKFRSKKMRVLINVPVPQERSKEAAATHKSIVDDRKLMVQAAIVRIMKARKTLPHPNLISEVVGQVSSKFKVKIPLIKRCIDILIDKEYIERSEDNSNVYTYLP